MALSNYGVLSGTITGRLDSPAAMQKNPGSKPHFQILVDVDGESHRIAVNVKSNQQPSDLQFFLNDNFNHPILDHVKQLPVGFTKLPKLPNTAALDYIRGNLFNIHDMRIVPTLLGGPNNDLNDLLAVHIDGAIETPGARIYAFGSKWGPEPHKEDAYFDFIPGNGIHDIHMNQGNSGRHAQDNGVYQDGGLFVYFPAKDNGEPERWIAMFLKFQSQTVHSNDTDAEPIEPAHPTTDPTQPTPDPVLPEFDTQVKIFAALVNPKGDDVGREFVYLVNLTGNDIDLNGWSIADKLKKKEPIGNKTIKANDVLKITLSGQHAQLSNEGGIITLLNAEGLKIDGVSYVKNQVNQQGAMVKF